MKQEKSCGAVVWAMEAGRRVYLIEQMLSGRWGLPKGHMEPGETEADTALREIREETGLTVTLDTAFREEVSYSPFPGCQKQVVFFTAEAASMDAVPQPEEVRALQWLPLQEALAALSHPNVREILEKADGYLCLVKGEG